MYNQGNYQQFGQRLPGVPPPPLQQPHPAYSIPQHSYLIPPRIPPPNPQGQQFYSLPPPPLLPGGILPPPPTSSYFTPSPFGSLSHLPPPPPPPPSSPPPGPPPLSPHEASESLSPDTELDPNSTKPSGVDLHDDILNCTAVNGSETDVKDTSTSDIPPPKPRDENTVRLIEVLCQYIAKNGDGFEEMTCQKEMDNPEFKFLFGGSPGSEAAISHEYFKWMKKKCSSTEFPDEGHNRDITHSPSGSDMDMEDDITHPEEHACDSRPPLHTDGNLFHSEYSGVKQSDESRVPNEGASPIRLIQGYASDNSSENDDDDGLHFENVSPVAVSPHIKQDANSLPLSAPVVERSSNTESKIPEPSRRTDDLENKTDSYRTRNQVDDDGNAKLEVDEFGRLIREGRISDDDSNRYKRRRDKRGRSRSRSRSPNGRRRRSPIRRRREKRSRSRSWSPKRRNRNRSPYRHREDSSADWTRRNKTQTHLPISDEKNESRFHKNKPYYQDLSDKSSDKGKEDFLEEVNSFDPLQQPVTESVTPVTESVTAPQLSTQMPNYPLLPVPWNNIPLPPPPPRPPTNNLLPHHQPLQFNYPFQPYYTQPTILPHFNPYASTFDQPLTTNFTQTQYDPLFDSIEPSSNSNKQKDADVAENDEFGETAGVVENDSPSSPIDLPDVATGEVEIDQVKNSVNSVTVKKVKDSRSMKLFKVSLAEFVKEVLKPSWRQGNMSKEAFKTIVKKTVDKVSGAMKNHQIPKTQPKINQYIDSSQRKLTKLVMGYVDKYVKV